jgi:mono/diheme cytochrome c family protein
MGKHAGWVIAFGLLAFALTPGCGGRGHPLLTEHPGYPTYKKHCKRCHGDLGNARKASRVAGRTVDLASPAYRDTVDLESVRRVVRNGERRMPAYAAKLTPQEIDVVSAYVLELAPARGRLTPPDPGLMEPR